MNLTIFLLYLVVCAIWILPRRPLMSLDSILVVAWLAPTAFALLGVISYEQDIGPRTLAVLLGYHLAMLAGITVARRPLAVPSGGGSFPLAALAVAVCGLTIALSMREATTSSLGGLDLAEVRAEHWEEIGQEAPTVSRRVLNWLVVLTIALGTPAALWWRSGRRVVAVMGVTALAAFGIQSLLTTGGRINAMIALLLLVASTLLSSEAAASMTWLTALRRILRPRPLAVIGLLVGAFWLAGVTIMQQRSRSLMERDIDEMLVESGAGHVSESGQFVIETLGLDGAYAVAATGYFTRPLFSLSFFSEHTDICDSYLWGRYNLRPITARLGHGQAFADARQYIAAVRGAAEMSLNPWATAWRDYAIDFGLLGGAAFAFVVGAVLQCVFSLMRRPSPVAVSGAALAVVVVLFTPYLSILFLGPILFGLIASVVIAKVSR